MAGGLGLGRSGGELQARAPGAELHNAIEFSAGRLELEVTELCRDVDVEAGDLRLERARIRVQLLVATDEEDADRLLEAAKAGSTISSSAAGGAGPD